MELKLYATRPHDCSYLPQREATTVFVDPDAEIDNALYTRLSTLGFRRSGPHLYRPRCAACSACIAARVPVAEFSPDRSQRRNLRANADLIVSAEMPQLDGEHYALYARYIRERHGGGDMDPPSPEQFESFLDSHWAHTDYWCFRADGRLLAVAVTDQLDDGLSAIYTFFDPDETRRALGVYAVLWQIMHTRELGLEHLYLGYWIKDCQKMSYKTRYRPLELLMRERWVRLGR